MHVLNPGEREYLSPNLIGVQNIAMTFLPLSMNFINIIDAFREIVNGVRYEILLNAVNTEDNNADIICRLVILEKPWLRTDWGDKVRELQFSNCTTEATTGNSTPLPPNQVNDKYVKSTVFNRGSRNELSADEMKHLEDQIFPSAFSYKRMQNFITSTTTTTEKSSANDDDQEAQPQTVHDATTTIPAVDNNYPNGQTFAETTEPASTTTDIEDDRAGNTNPTELPQYQTISSTTTAAPALSADEMKWLDDIFSVGGGNFANNLSARQTANHNPDNSHDNLHQQQEQVNFSFTSLTFHYQYHYYCFMLLYHCYSCFIRIMAVGRQRRASSFQSSYLLSARYYCSLFVVL